MVFNLGTQRRPKHRAKREWLMSWTCSVFVFCLCDSEVRFGGWTWFFPAGLELLSRTPAKHVICSSSSCTSSSTLVAIGVDGWISRFRSTTFCLHVFLLFLQLNLVSARPRPKCPHRAAFISFKEASWLISEDSILMVMYMMYPHTVL